MISTKGYYKLLLIMDILKTTTVQSIVPADQKLVYVPADATVEQAIFALKQTEVTHLPIGSAGAPDQHTISYSDLIRFLVEKDFDQFAFLNAKVLEAVVPHTTILVEPTTTVYVLLDKMVSSHPYRVGVAVNQHIQSVVSQIDLIKFLYSYRQQLLPTLVNKTMLDVADLGSVNLHSITESTSVKDACRILRKKSVNAVAVVNEIGAMKACLTPLSFHNLSSTHWPDLNLPIKVFELEGRGQGWVVPETTVEQVVQLLIDHRLHRIWVIGDDEKPKRIITLTDVLQYFAAHITGKPHVSKLKKVKNHMKEKKVKKELAKEEKKEKHVHVH